MHRALEFNQFQWLKQYLNSTHKKEQKQKANADKDGKVLYNLVNNAVYGKTMENIRNRINVKLLSNKKSLFKMGIQIKLYVRQNI